MARVRSARIFLTGAACAVGLYAVLVPRFGQTARDENLVRMPLRLAGGTDLGSVEQEAVVEHQVPAFNDSSDTVVIREVVTGCGCLGVSRIGDDGGTLPLVGTSIAPHKSITLAVRFRPNGQVGGAFEQVARIRYRAAENYELLVVVTGRVRDAVTPFPRNLDFGEVPPHGQATGYVTLTTATANTFVPTHPVSNDNRFTVELVSPDATVPGLESPPEGQSRVGVARVTFRAGETTGRVSTTVTIALRDDSRSVVIPTTGFVRSRYRLTPRVATVAGPTGTCDIVCSSVAGESFVLADFQTAPGLRVERLTPEAALTTHRFRVIPDGPIPDGAVIRVRAATSGETTGETLSLPVVSVSP